MKPETLLKEFLVLKEDLVKNRSGKVVENLKNHKIDIYRGVASFVDANHIEVIKKTGKTKISGKFIIVAGGVKTILPEDIPIDGERIHIVETLFKIIQCPLPYAYREPSYRKRICYHSRPFRNKGVSD